jgi:hypothetical protein
MVDEAYSDRTEWVKKSIRTTAKVRPLFTRACFVRKTPDLTTGSIDGQV